MLKAVLFDFDGTIVESEESRHISINHVLKDFNINISNIDWQNKYVPLSTHIILDQIKKDNNLDFNIDNLYKKSHKFREDYIKINGLKFVKGFKKFLKFLQKNNIKTCICSGGSTSHIKNNLDSLGLDMQFVSRDMVDFEKPKPDLYLKGLEILNVKSDETIAFDDSLTGVQAAINANIKIIAINYPKNIGIEKLNCYKFINNYLDLDFTELL